jgi:hypothetical protein
MYIILLPYSLDECDTKFLCRERLDIDAPGALHHDVGRGNGKGASKIGGEKSVRLPGEHPVRHTPRPACPAPSGQPACGQ